MMQRWQDKVGVALGVILFLLPWLAGFSGVTAAAASAWIIGIATVVFFGIAVAKPGQWEEWVNIVLAVLLLLSPLVLGFTGVTAAAWSHWVLAILIGGDAIWALAQARQGSGATA